MVKFTVPGDPKPQGRPRFARFGKFVRTYDPKDSMDFKSKVASFAREAGVLCVDYPVTVKIDFYIKRPKNLMRKKDSINAVACPRRPDADNLLKAILDALNGIAYRDDGQVWSVELKKWYHEIGGSQRTEVEIN